jgi:hypothetical protein
MSNKIPKYLYRGDSDKSGVRLLKNTLHFNQFQTNLINGGNGREIIEKPILNLIDKHVGIGWSPTCFLSFSKCEKIAFRFGMHCGISEVDKEIERCIEYFENDNNWEFVIITIDTQKINWHFLEDGVYEGLYKPSLAEFANLVNYRIALIDVAQVLQNTDDYKDSLENALRDEEWLILPATLIPFSNGYEYSAILDGNCISDIKRFKR